MSARFISLDDMIRCADREAALRKRVYPKWINDERMSQDKADYEIACMEAIAEKLKNIAGRVS
jgi:hypothetical protein